MCRICWSDCLPYLESCNKNWGVYIILNLYLQDLSVSSSGKTQLLTCKIMRFTVLAYKRVKSLAYWGWWAVGQDKAFNALCEDPVRYTETAKQKSGPEIGKGRNRFLNAWIETWMMYDAPIFVAQNMKISKAWCSQGSRGKTWGVQEGHAPGAIFLLWSCGFGDGNVGLEVCAEYREAVLALLMGYAGHRDLPPNEVVFSMASSGWHLDIIGFQVIQSYLGRSLEYYLLIGLWRHEERINESDFGPKNVGSRKTNCHPMPRVLQITSASAHAFACISNEPVAA